MIEIIDTIALGTTLKEIRKAQKLSQKELAERIGLNEKSYRDIELGKREPTLKTLFKIERVFKTDLIKYLKESHYNSQYNGILNIIDELIFAGNVEKINRITQNFSKLKSKYLLVEPKELIQFKGLLEALTEILKNTNASFNKAIDLCIEAINVIEREDKFEIPKLESFQYSLLEYRILFSIGGCFNRLKDYEKSIHLSKFIIERLSHNALDSHDSHKLIIKCYVNLSYDYNMMFQDQESIKYADLGIECCKKMETFFLLYNLLFRKGASYFYLKNYEMMDKYIHESLTLLKILGKEDIYKVYLETAQSKFNHRKKTYEI
jgi:transcriptional regulator with XRE-family HTH domain